jgi:hypothetical protein
VTVTAVFEVKLFPLQIILSEFCGIIFARGCAAKQKKYKYYEAGF